MGMNQPTMPSHVKVDPEASKKLAIGLGRTKQHSELKPDRPVDIGQDRAAQT
jgi:hypothetical protein